MCFISITLTACSRRIINETDLPKRHVAIGSYGGFSGLNEKLIILKNGLVFKAQQMPGAKTEVKFYKLLPKKEVRQIFKTVKQIHFDSLAPVQTGNMNYYIDNNRLWFKDKHWQWGDNLDSSSVNFKSISQLLKLVN